ncbi:ComF family protein [Rossellomorea sp. NS-SX7]|uniref:ComF family protein n=1 Tax=Rossellomorea sp. NS-SX7 TaxID=3463856 RepID=UPI0040590D02
MFSLCTNLRNIIIDLDSLTQFLNKQDFESLVRELNFKYNVYCVTAGPNSVNGQSLYVCRVNEPISLSTFLNSYELNPYHTVLLTGCFTSIEHAHGLNLSTILLIESIDTTIDNKHLPDLILNLKHLREVLINNKIKGSYNEITVEQLRGQGYLLPIGQISHQLDEDIKANLLYAGRYFVFNDYRYYTHCLSNMINRLKKFKPYAADSLARCLKTNIEIARRNFKDIDLVTVVPPKPDAPNQLDLIIDHELLNSDRDIIDTNLLFTVRPYEKQKQAGSFHDRALNVLDAFACRKRVNGHVLLIDDVLTSGSTTMECAKVLYNSGASKVTILPLAIMQSNANGPFHAKISDENNEEYRLNFKHANGKPFWVASEGEFLGYNAGKERYLRQFNFKDFEIEELPF